MLSRHGVSALGSSTHEKATLTVSVMGPLRELLAIDHRQTLEFFVLRLQNISEPTIDRQELLYNASLLAHYAQVSTQPDVDVPAPANLSAVFDHFVADTTLLDYRLMMETAGAQCLLLAGFFEDQMRRRHNIRWYAELGASFFSPGHPFTSSLYTKPGCSTPSPDASSRGVGARRS
jgi:hypothetical protein